MEGETPPEVISEEPIIASIEKVPEEIADVPDELYNTLLNEVRMLSGKVDTLMVETGATKAEHMMFNSKVDIAIEAIQNIPEKGVAQAEQAVAKLEEETKVVEDQISDPVEQKKPEKKRRTAYLNRKR